MAADGLKGNLVDARWLEKNLQNPDVLVLDASFAKMYAAKHIPGAVSVNLFKLMTYRDTRRSSASPMIPARRR